MWVSKVIIHKNESTELVDYVLKIFLLKLSILSRNVTSHNDPHVGNLFLRDGNSSLYDRFIFIDFDNAAFGYRAWDILYYLTKFPEVSRKSLYAFLNLIKCFVHLKLKSKFD